MVTGNILFAGIGDDPKQADKEQLREIFRFFLFFSLNIFKCLV